MPGRWRIISLSSRSSSLRNPRGKARQAVDAHGAMEDRSHRPAPARRSVTVVVAACAASAGAHAGLVPQHLAHEPRLGVAFIATTAVLD
jgi:hypothetical protein